MARKGMMTQQLESLLLEAQLGSIELNQLVEQFSLVFETDIDSHELRKMIYRRLEYQCDSGVLQKLPYDGKAVRYLKTNLNLPLDVFKSFDNAIEIRVREHQRELACFDGSCDEYQSLAKKHPELQDELMMLYQEADLKRSIVLGKLEAIRNAKALSKQPA